jgi:hypothetical protein
MIHDARHDELAASQPMRFGELESAMGAVEAALGETVETHSPERVRPPPAAAAPPDLDVGRKGFDPHLSSQAAQDFLNHRHPRQQVVKTNREDGSTTTKYKTWDLCHPFGWHSLTGQEFDSAMFKGIMFFFFVTLASGTVWWLILNGGGDKANMWKAMCAAIGAFGMMMLCAVAMSFSRCLGSNSEEGDDPLSQYGVGMVLHFKLLKFMAAMFGILSFLSFPSLFLFVNGSVYPAGQLGDWRLALAMTTLGSIGDAEPICGKISVTGNSSVLRLECPSELQIASFTAFYGNPIGQCGCSDTTCSRAGLLAGEETCKVSDDGTCPTTASATWDPARPQDSYIISVEPVLNQDCCGIGNPPPFTSLIAAPNRTRPCSSSNMNDAITAKCKGRSSCTIDIHEDFVRRSNEEGQEGDRQEGDRRLFSIADGMPWTWANATDLDRDLARGKFDWTPEELAAPLCTAEDNTLIVVASCYAPTITVTTGGKAHSVQKEDLAWVVIVLDTLGITIWLIMLRWLKGEQETAVQTTDQDAITAEDYTLRLVRVPRHSNIDEVDLPLRDHLERVINSQAAKFCSAGRGKGGNAGAKCSVAAIVFARNNSSIISMERHRAKIKLQREIISNRIHDIATLKERQKEATPGTSTAALDLRLAVAHKRMKQLLLKLEKLLLKMSAQFMKMEKHNHARSAYVTFETEEGRMRCEESFRKPAFCAKYDETIKFVNPASKQASKLKFEQTSNPGTLLWENLNFTKEEKFVRRSITQIVIIVCLVVSGVLIALAKTKNQKVARQFPPTICPEAKVTDTQLQQAFAMMPGCANPPLLDCYCTQVLSEFPSEILDFPINFTGTDALSGSTIGTNCTTKYMDPSSRNLCKEWVENKAILYGLTFGSIAAVLVINGILSTLMRKLARFEKHKNITEENLSKARKSFIAQLMNTCFVMLIVNMNTALWTDTNRLSGSFTDFTSKWYTTVGSSIVLTMGLNIISPNIMPFIKYLIHECKMRSDRGCHCCDSTRSKKLTQSDYNSMFIGPDWLISDRYGQLLNVIFITFIFSSFMPILYWFAAANFVIVYWVDKFVFLRLHRTPPTMDEDLAKSVSALLPLTAVAHFACTAWAFSNPDILSKQGVGTFETSSFFVDIPSASVGESKGFFQVLLFDRFSNCVAAVYFPFVMFLLIIVGVITHKLLLKHILAILHKLLELCLCPRPLKTDVIEDLPNYTETLPLEYLEKQLAEDEGGTVRLGDKRRLIVEAAIQNRVKADCARVIAADQGKPPPPEPRLMSINSPVDYNMSSNSAYEFMESGDMQNLKNIICRAQTDLAADLGQGTKPPA